jgi:hypothetical protein
MAQRIYRIRKAVLVPLGIDAVLLLALLTLSFGAGGQTTEQAVLSVFFGVAAILFLESLLRRVVVAPERLLIRKLGRGKSFTWAEITHVGALTVRRKAYLLLTTLKGFVILSSAYEGFADLSREIAGRVEPDRVDAQVRGLAAGSAHAASAWVAAVFLVGILLLKLLGGSA